MKACDRATWLDIKHPVAFISKIVTPDLPLTDIDRSVNLVDIHADGPRDAIK